MVSKQLALVVNLLDAVETGRCKDLSDGSNCSGMV